MSPAPISQRAVASVEYRYILVNTMDDQVLAELPFQNVSYSNVLNEAGVFSGDIPVNPTTMNFDLYNVTIPGLCSIYVLRDGVCVWGGIISNRIYNAKERLLNVSADQFVSYLDRRVLWKTWSTKYGCRIDLEDMVIGGETKRIGKVTLLGNATFSSTDAEGLIDSAFISFGADEDLAALSGTYRVLDDPAPDPEGKYFYFGAYYKPVDQSNFRPIGEDGQRIAEPTTSVEFKQTTRRYLRDLIRNHFNDDTYDLAFANNAIASARVRRLQIAGLSRVGNEATITVNSREPHNLVVGQRIAIRDLSSPHTSFNREKTVVTEIVDSLRFKYQTTTSGDVSPTTPGIVELTVDRYLRENDPTGQGLVTVVTDNDHNLQVGDIISVTSLDPRIDGTIRYEVYTVGKVKKGSTTDPDKVFQFKLNGPKIGNSKAPSAARIRKIPIVELYTGGPFKGNSDIGIQFNDDTFSGINATEKIYHEAIRGYELKTFKEIIDTYSNDTFGFDYRIDCEYDAETNTFSKEFKFLPLKPESFASSNTVINALGAITLDENSLIPLELYEVSDRIFEYPGNISDVVMTETIEEGATRVWTQGTISELSSEISQPYAGIGDTTLLNRNWPLFDKVIRNDKLSRAEPLYSLARGVLGQSQLPVSTFEITVNGSLPPVVSSYKPGDWCIITVDDLFIQQRLLSYLENKGDNSRVVLLRKIAGISVTVPVNPGFPEIVTLTLVTEPGIDINGEQVKWKWPVIIGGGGIPYLIE